MYKSNKSDENGPREYCTLYCTLQLQLTPRAHAKYTAGSELETLRNIVSIQTTSPIGVFNSPISESVDCYCYL